MDTTELGSTAAQLMEMIEEEEPDAEMGVVMILAEINGCDEDGGWSSIRWRCSDPRVWVQDGMLHAALDGARIVD